MDKQEIIERIFEGTNFLVRGKRYHSELPPELTAWYCFTSDGGHSILCLIKGHFDESGTDTWTFLCPCPVKSVLRDYKVLGDFIVVDLPYDEHFGLSVGATDSEF